MRLRSRHVVRLSACFVAGVMITIVIAWALALTVDVYRATSRGGLAPRGEVHWSTSAYRRFGSLVATSGWRYRQNPGTSARDPGEIVPAWMPGREPPEAMQRGEIIFDEYSIDARGWPLLSMYSQVHHYRALADKPSDNSGVRGGLETGLAPWVIVRARTITTAAGTPRTMPAHTQPRILPLRPIWSGFIVNSLIFSATLWFCLFGWRDIRTALRMRSGRCIACGYPTGSSAVCTECGAQLPRG